ncbi:MAG: DinB family protein [Gemmatimonadota bacterium]|nr:DinB family protein [Gemmatimonadota bacterium]
MLASAVRDATKRAIRATLRRLTPEQLAADYPETVRGVRLRTGAYLLKVTVHLAYHLGQIDYHRRMVTGDRTSLGAIGTADLDLARPTGS